MAPPANAEAKLQARLKSNVSPHMAIVGLLVGAAAIAGMAALTNNVDVSGLLAGSHEPTPEEVCGRLSQADAVADNATSRAAEDMEQRVCIANLHKLADENPEAFKRWAQCVLDAKTNETTNKCG